MKSKLDFLLKFIVFCIMISGCMYYYTISNTVTIKKTTIYTKSGHKMENCDIKAYYPNDTYKPLSRSSVDKNFFEVKLENFEYSCFGDANNSGFGDGYFGRDDGAVVLSGSDRPYRYYLFSYKKIKEDTRPKYIGISD